MAGSTVSLPASGTAALRAVNSATGATVGITSAGWTRIGTEIRFTSPAAVNAWGNAQIGADALEFELDSFAVSSAPGQNELSVTLLHQGQVRAAQTTLWNSGCGNFHYCDEP